MMAHNNAFQRTHRRATFSPAGASSLAGTAPLNLAVGQTRWMELMSVAFRALDAERLSGCLSRLAPHVRLDELAITGGVAIQIGLAEVGRPGSRDAIADLDIVARFPDAVRQTVIRSFLLSHYHVVQPGVPKFMIQLVDAVSRIRVDVFPDLVGSVHRAKEVMIGTRLVKVLALEDILEHKLQTLLKASPSRPVDPKHARDAHALGALFGRTIPRIAPASLAPDVYGNTDTYLSCSRCESSADPRFPLAPKAKIFDLLGYV